MDSSSQLLPTLSLAAPRGRVVCAAAFATPSPRFDSVSRSAPLPLFSFALSNPVDRHLQATQHISMHQTTGQAAPVRWCDAISVYCVCVFAQWLERAKQDDSRTRFRSLLPLSARSLTVHLSPPPHAPARQGSTPHGEQFATIPPYSSVFLFASLAHFRFPCCRGPGVGRLSHWTIPPPDPDDRQAWGTEPLAISTRYMTIIALPN